MNLGMQPNRRAEDRPALGSFEPSLAGRIAYRLLPFRRRIVRSNLRRAFGAELTEPEQVRLAQAFYGHALRSLWEFASFSLLSESARATRSRLENKEAMDRTLEQGRGALVLAGHLGNWETGLAGAILHYPELRGRVNVLRRPVRPLWLERWMINRFRAAGIGTIAKRDSMRTIIERLAANEVVAFVLDQHTARKEGVQVNFFGSPAWTFRSLAVIARRTHAPVVPVAIWREPNGRLVLRVEEPLIPIAAASLDEFVRANTQLYNDTLETLIRRHPEQWNWIHRRWKDPPAREVASQAASSYRP